MPIRTACRSRFPGPRPRHQCVCPASQFHRHQYRLVVGHATGGRTGGVIAHEIAHVSQKHIVRAIADMKRLTLPLAAAMVASAALAAASGQAGQAAMVGTMAASAQHQISFTRANEQEADRIGMQLLAKAGFDPRGMSDFFTKLERMSSGEARKPSSRNVADASTPGESRRRYPGSNRDPTAAVASPPRSPSLRARARLGTGAGDRGYPYSYQGVGNPAGQGRCIRPNRHALCLRAGPASGWPLRRGRQQVARLVSGDPDRLAFRIEAAEIALAQGDRQQAWRLFEEARKLYPDDFTLAMHYGRALATRAIRSWRCVCCNHTCAVTPTIPCCMQVTPKRAAGRATWRRPMPPWRNIII